MILRGPVICQWQWRARRIFGFLQGSLNGGGMATALEQMGGQENLQRVVDDFVDRMVRDPMIGFHFRGVDVIRLKGFEAQFAAVVLGSGAPYEGRAVRPVHARHPISGGQFSRRKELLRQTLDHHQVPAAVCQVWLDHTEMLRQASVRGPQDGCGSAGSFGALVTEVAADGSDSSVAASGQ